MSRLTRAPVSEVPIGTRSRSRAGLARQASSASKARTSPSPSSSMKSMSLWVSGAASSTAARGHGVQRREPAREGLGLRQRALVDLGPHRLLAQPQGADGVAPVGQRLALELQPEPGGVLELVPPHRQVQDGHAVHAVVGHDVVAGRQLDAVQHQQDVRRRRALVGAEPGPLAEVRRQQRGQLVERRRHHPHRPDRVRALAALAVRQPLEPVPVGEVLVGGEHRDDEVVRRLERGRRADHRPGQRAGRLLGPADLDPVEGPQVDGRRQVGLQPVYDEQPVQRGRGRRVDLVDGRALRRDQLERQRLVAQAVADVQEVGVGAAVLPQPGPLLGQRGQRRRVGVVPAQRLALLVGGLAGDLADVAEVAEVLGAGARSPAAPAASAAGRAGRR